MVVQTHSNLEFVGGICALEKTAARLSGEFVMRFELASDWAGLQVV